jgi:hypothetical protein
MDEDKEDPDKRPPHDVKKEHPAELMPEGETAGGQPKGPA